MRTISCLLVLFSLSLPTQAYQPKSFNLGFGYYSQSVLSRVANSASGSGSFLGTTYYPLQMQYEMAIFTEWYFAPRLNYTLIPRDAEGSGSVTFMHVTFGFGKNFGWSGDGWDWAIGPAFMQQTFKGKGGTVELLNGSTPTTFDLPAREVTTRKVGINFGTSYSALNSKFGADLIIENMFSQKKRNYNLLFSYMYRFGGNGL